MPLFPKHNVTRPTENRMELDIIEFLRNSAFKVKVYNQVRHPDIGRISDIIILKGSRLINIECKLNNVGGALNQAKDHLLWADYSYIAMPDRAYISNDWKKSMIENGVGLLLWHDEKILIEAIYAKYQRPDKFKKIERQRKLKILKFIDTELQKIELKKRQLSFLNNENIRTKKRT